MVIRP
jgi:hypothetical protein